MISSLNRSGIQTLCTQATTLAQMDKWEWLGGSMPTGRFETHSNDLHLRPGNNYGVCHANNEL